MAATVAKAQEQRLTALREEAPALEREAVDESDLARALEVFDPVWAALAPREQARSLRLLIERVGYDGPGSSPAQSRCNVALIHQVKQGGRFRAGT